MRRLLPLLLLLVVGLVTARPGFAPMSRDPVAGVGWVLARDVGKGSGWVVDAEKRWLVTCWHVVGESATVEVAFPVASQVQRAWYLEHMPDLRERKQVVRGKVLHREPGVDLALVELESLPKGVIALPLAAQGAVPGERVVAVGNRYDTELLWLRAASSVRQVHPLKDGYASGGKQVAEGAWVVDARVPINEGDSGGPLLTPDGAVVGVLAAVAWEHQGSAYAIDLRELRAFLKRAGAAMPVGVATPRAVPEVPARELYPRWLPATVLVLPRETRRRGSGWIVDRERRLVLTGAELLGERKTATVRFPMAGSEPATGIVLARDERRNLALLELDRLPEKARAGKFAEVEPVPGDPLHAITHASRPDLDWLYLGTLLRQIGPVKVTRAEGEEPRTLLLQALVSDGEEGAAILDNQGNVVGQHTGKGPPQQQIAYAVSAGEVRAFLKQQQSRWDPRGEADRLARARLFREARAEDRALGELNHALEVAPNSATACSERSGLLLDRGHVEAALADAERAVKLAPDHAAGWCRRAEAHAVRGELRDALADSEKALTLDRQSADVQRVRAEVLRQLGRYAEAIPHADEAIWLDRKSAAGYRLRGRIHLDRDDALKAIDDLDQALRLDDEDALAYRLRGEARWNRSDVRGAQADFEAALQRNRDDARAWLGRGRATDSAEDFTQALRCDPHVAAAYLERGAIRLLGPSPGLGLDDLAEAVRLQPGLREAAQSRTRRAVRSLERSDAERAGRVALGAVPRLWPTRDGRLWWDLPPEPVRWIELLSP